MCCIVFVIYVIRSYCFEQFAYNFLLQCFYSAAELLAMQSAVLVTAIPSVCLSATRWYPTQMKI